MLYFFNVAGVVQETDRVGHKFGTQSEARIAAAKFAGEYLRDRPEVVWMGEEFRVEVSNGDRELLFTFIAFGVDAPAAPGRLRI